MFHIETMGNSSAAGIVSLKAYIKHAGISTITGWRWRKKGWLKTINIAGREYVRAEDVAEFERRGRCGGNSLANSVVPPSSPETERPRRDESPT